MNYFIRRSHLPKIIITTNILKQEAKVYVLAYIISVVFASLLQATGMKKLADQYVDSLKQQCETVISAKPIDGGTDTVLNNLCPGTVNENACSNHGTCNKGKNNSHRIISSRKTLH